MVCAFRDVEGEEEGRGHRKGGTENNLLFSYGRGENCFVPFTVQNVSGRHRVVTSFFFFFFFKVKLSSPEPRHPPPPAPILQL